MKKRGFNMIKLAQEISVSPPLVSFTINGEKHSPRVLDGLLKIGIDPALLHDPRAIFTQRQAD